MEIPIKSIPTIKPPKMLDELDEVVPESLSESEDDPLLDDPPNKSSTSEPDDSTSASASNSTKFLP